MRPDVGNSNRWKEASQNMPAAVDGSGKARNKPVLFQKRLWAADYILPLFCTVKYHKPYPWCNQKYQITFSNIQKISSSASSVRETIGGTLQNHSFIDTWENPHAVLIRKVCVNSGFHCSVNESCAPSEFYAAYNGSFSFIEATPLCSNIYFTKYSVQTQLSILTSDILKSVM